MKSLASWVLVAVTIAGTGCVDGSERSQRSPDRRPARTINEEQPLPRVARLRCDEQGVTLLTPKVRPQRDGVHVLVRTTFDTGLAWQFGGRNAPEGVSRHVLPITPGHSRLGCDAAEPNEDPRLTTLTVEDTKGIWIPSDMDCKYVLSGTGSTVLEQRGRKGNPIELTRRDYAKKGDRVMRVGYPEQRMVEVVVKRDGRAIRLTEWWPMKGGRWSVDHDSQCTNGS